MCAVEGSGIKLSPNLNCYFYRSATKGEINKAYRKLARKWHPDSYDGENKEKAEKMFLDIAAAKEVLTDPGEWEF